MDAVIIHGGCDEEEYFNEDFPSPSNAHWIPWLQQKFLRENILCQALEMPKPYAPVYEEWKTTFEQLDFRNISIVVAHSAGCGFILKWLSESKNATLDKLVLVAPWQDPKKKRGTFLECVYDPALESRIDQIHVLFSSDDSVQGIKETTDKITSIYKKSKLHLYEDKGHFCIGDLKTTTFEDLWAICLK